MKKNKMLTRNLLKHSLIALLIMFSAGSASAQSLSVRAELEDRDRLFVGETTTLKLILEGAKADSAPTFKSVSGLKIDYQGVQDRSMSTMSSINGKVTRSVTKRYSYVYAVTIQSESVKAIPGAVFVINGQSYQSKPISITVIKPQESDDFKLRVKPQKTQLYVGEPCEIEIKVYTLKKITSLDFNLPGNSAFELHSDNSNPLTDRQAKAQGVILAKIMGGRTEIRTSKETLGNHEYLVYSFNKILVPTKPGSQTFGPITVQLQAVVGERRRSAFGSFFGNNEVTKKFVIPSKSTVFNVKALPPAPASFTGLIGSCSIQTQASPLRVRVGDPIKLTVKVSTSPPLDRIKMPLLSSQNWVSQFKYSNPEAKPEVKAGWLTQNWTIRARNDSLTSIPPLEMTFFNTATGQFETAKSDPIAIEVQKSHKVTLDDLPAAPTAAQASAAQTELVIREPGIVHNYESADVVDSQGLRRVSDFFTIFNCLLMFGPLAGYIGLIFWRKLKENDVFIRRKERSQALSTALSQLKGSQSQSGKDQAESASRACCEFVARLTNKAPSAMSKNDAVSAVAEHSEANADKLAKFLNACDSARFGNGQLATADLADAPTILKAIHEVLP